MRLSRPRVLLRIALLVIGGVYMLVRAVELYRTARPGAEAPGTLASRLALVWGLMGLLALLTAATATWAAFRRPPKRTLHLDDLPHQPGAPEGSSARRAGDDRGSGR